MIGAERKEKRLDYLRHYWMNKVKDLPGVQLLSPMKSGFGSAIGLIYIKGRKPVDLDAYLFARYKIHTSPFDWNFIKGVRITPNVYTTTKHLDVLVEGITQFIKSA